MKVLITGFDPFGGENINPALEAVKLLPDNISDAEVIKIEIPTVFRKSLEKINEEIEKYLKKVNLLDNVMYLDLKDYVNDADYLKNIILI